MRRRFARNKSKESALAKKKKESKKQNAIQRFVRETVGELRKVTWPTRQEAMNLTFIVLVVMLFMSLYLGLMDIVFGALRNMVLGI
ncbi:MAG: preprotein translocase subunit SecE [Anaerolineae bacterium]|nr:MAG: preprotein translocase subunit SecE [Anaerolineae bacterium]